MKYELKNYIWANIIALAGYPLFWYIKELVQIAKVNSLYGFFWITSLILCPYIFVTFLLAFIVFLIEYICKNKLQTNYRNKDYNLCIKILFYTGFVLYLIFLIFCIFYILYAIIYNLYFQ